MLDPSKSLAQLGGDIGWDGPTENGYKSSLITRVEGLYDKPLGEFSPGELRVMIGQNIALQYLVPLALDVLMAEPLVEGDYHPGDLLGVVLECGKSRPYTRFWSENAELRERLRHIVQRLDKIPSEIEGSVKRYLAGSLTSAAPDQAPPAR